MPLDLGDHTTRLVPTARLVTEALVQDDRLFRRTTNGSNGLPITSLPNASKPRSNILRMKAWSFHDAFILGRTEPIKATGTLSASADPQQIQQQIHQQSVHKTMRNGASQYENDKFGVLQDRTSDDTVNADFCETKRNDAAICDHDAGVTQLVEYQPKKLTFDL